VTLPTLHQWTSPREALILLVSGATTRTCLPIALVVGTVLSLVNQADVIVRGGLDFGILLKIVINFLIPFLTSSTGALLAFRAGGRE
jgi:type III secretory pathway component EscS